MDALSFVQILVGKMLCYGIKSPDTDLYDFGFSQKKHVDDPWEIPVEEHDLILHATCNFDVVCKNGIRRVDKYHADTPCEEFNSEITNIIGLCVKRVAVGTGNNLWLDFGDYWVVFITFDDGEESWRLFSPIEDGKHLVATNINLDF